jgi:transcriptional regulator with XRE-family HTH domain
VNRIKEVIQESGLKAKYIAEQIGCADTDISNYCSEVRSPNHDRLIKLTKVLSCTINDLYPNAKRVVSYDLGLGE